MPPVEPAKSRSSTCDVLSYHKKYVLAFCASVNVNGDAGASFDGEDSAPQSLTNELSIKSPPTVNEGMEWNWTRANGMPPAGAELFVGPNEMQLVLRSESKIVSWTRSNTTGWPVEASRKRKSSVT